MSLTVWIMSGWLYCRNRNLGSNCTWTKIGLDLQNIKVSVMVFQQAQYSSTASIPVSIAYAEFQYLNFFVPGSH